MSSNKNKTAPPPGHTEAAERTKTSDRAEGGADTASPSSDAPKNSPLYISYPVNSVVELTLAPHGEVVRGLVYCTDEVSNSVVLKKSLRHSTLTSEIRIINASSVQKKKTIEVGAGSKEKAGNDNCFDGASEKDDIGFDVTSEELSLPLPNVSRKALEERERRAIRLAEESFSHINQKATPEGQKVFDRLLKACNEVVWRGESILVLNQIRVDPPYGKDDCKPLGAGGAGGLHEESLDRVKKIVASAFDR